MKRQKMNHAKDRKVFQRTSKPHKSNTVQSGGPSTRLIKKYKRLNTSVAYKSGATVGDVTDITSGGLYVITYRDADISMITDPSATVNVTGDIRLLLS